MSDQEQTQNADGTDDVKKEQTVTAEQFATLQKQLEQITAAQSGSDRKVKELTEALNAAKQEKEKTAKTDADRIAALEKESAANRKAADRERLKTFARGILDKASIKPPPYFDRLIGDDEEDTKQWVDDFVKDEQVKQAERNKQYDRDNGRKVDTSGDEKVDTWDKLLTLSDDQLSRMDPKEIKRLTELAQGR